VPVPGNNVQLHTQSQQSLQSLLLDVASLAERLEKPLVCRILPVPGKMKGDMINFERSQYMINCKVVYFDKENYQGLDTED